MTCSATASGWRCWRCSKNPRRRQRKADGGTLMPLDPDAQTLLDMVKEANRPAFETVSPAEARAAFMAARPVLGPEPMPVAELRDLAIPGPAGPIPARLYRPSAGGTLPALVFFHGRGRVVRNVESHHTM